MKSHTQPFIPLWVLALVVFLMLGGVALAIGKELTLRPGGVTTVTTAAASLGIISTTTGTSTP